MLTDWFRKEDNKEYLLWLFLGATLTLISVIYLYLEPK